MEEINSLEKIQKERLVAVIRTQTKEKFFSIASTLLENDFTVIEVTLTTPNAMEIIEELSLRKNAVIGAGTVVNVEQAKKAIRSGATFIVSPYFDRETAQYLSEYQIPYIPGCMTVKEMAEAMKYGCELLKLFPASQFSSKIINDIKGPLPDIKIMPTGWVDSSNAKDWLKSGSFAVGIGSEITKVFDEKGKQGLIKYIQKLLNNIK